MEESHDCVWPAGLSRPAMPGERRERRDAAAHRKRILEVAQHLFTEQGVEGVSMHQIAVTAGLGQGTLYRRYANKGDLCMDLLRESYEQYAGEVAALLVATEAAPALERLDAVLSKTVALLEEQGALLGPVSAAAAPDIREDARECGEQGQPDSSNSARRFSYQRSPLYQWSHDLFAGLLNEAVERGELPPLDVIYAADAIMAALYPPFYRFQRQERGFPPERILQGLRRIYIDGVKTPEQG